MLLFIKCYHYLNLVCSQVVCNLKPAGFGA